MANLKEADFYYGSVLSGLLCRNINPAIVENDKDRQIMRFTTDQGDFILFLKYRSKPADTKNPTYRSWQFSFSPDDKHELQKFLSQSDHLSLGLVCADDKLDASEYAVLHKEDIQTLFDLGKTSFTISRKKGEKAYRIHIGGGRSRALHIPSNRAF